MKKTHGLGNGTPQSAADGLVAADKKKLIIMGVLLLLLGVGYLASSSAEDKYKREEDQQAAHERPVVEQIFVPEFDFVALNEIIDDSESGALRVEATPLGQLIEHASLLTGSQYDVLGTINLTAVENQRLIANPQAVRGQAVRARGTIETLIGRTRASDGRKYIEGRLRLEDGSPCYFAVTRLPVDDEGPATPGTFVRLNGLFMKGYRAETDNGWETGPFIVGRNAVFSYESVGDRVTSLPKSMMRLVEDDSIMEGSRGESFSAYWTMLAYARDLQEGDIDWETVPELDNIKLGEILADGEKFRAQPFRIPISVNMETRQKTIAENPARLETVSEGWIGNQNWSAGNGLIKFKGPFGNPGLKRKDLVTARGFFFRNHLYEPAKGGAALAPLFVLVDIEKFTPEAETRIPMIFAGVVAVTIALIGLLVFLLSHDKRKSKALQDALIRRKRERRARLASGSPNPGQA